MDKERREIKRRIENSQGLHRVVFNQLYRMMNINVEYNTSTFYNIPAMRRIPARRAKIEIQLYKLNNHIIYLLNQLSKTEFYRGTGATDEEEIDQA